MKVDVRSNIKSVVRNLNNTQRKKVPAAIRFALNDTAFQTMMHSRKAIKREFSKPSRRSTNSARFHKATKTNLTAHVYIDGTPGLPDYGSGTPPVVWMEPNIEGGMRGHKPHEKHLIAHRRMNSNQYGVWNNAFRNRTASWKGGRTTQILSQLKSAETYAGYNMNQTAGSKKRAGKSRNQHFVIKRGGQPLGIFVREGKKIKNVIGFTNRPPAYSRIYPFYADNHRHATKIFPALFVKRINQFVARG